MNATQAASIAPVSRRRTRTFFYIGIALLFIAIALAGFWPRYYGQLLTEAGLERRSSHPLIHLHSTLFMGWLLMLLGQATLARSGHIKIHMRVGPLLAAYGYAAAVIGFSAGLVLAARRVEFGATVDEAATFAFITTSDMLTFAGLLTAAVIWRNSPEAHKRLMVLTTWALAIVGFNRLLYGNFPVLLEYRTIVSTMLMPLPAFIGIAHDWTTKRRVHIVWWIGLAVFVAWANRGIIGRSEAWLPIGRALIRPFL